MSDVIERCYCQTIELTAKDHVLRSELCIAYVSLHELLPHTHTILHPHELAYFSTLTFERRQLSYLLGRFAAKEAVAHYTGGTALSEILIDYGAFQYPIVYHPGTEKIQVSYSHSDQCAVALAFPETYPMGIDLELIDSEKTAVIETQLTQEDKRLLQELNDPYLDRLFTLAWTMKEALSKVLRTGMTTPFEIFEFKNIKRENQHWISEFKNFTQYQALSFPLGKFICSIVHPKRSQLILDTEAIHHWLEAQ